MVAATIITTRGNIWMFWFDHMYQFIWIKFRLPRLSTGIRILNRFLNWKSLFLSTMISLSKTSNTLCHHHPNAYIIRMHTSSEYCVYIFLFLVLSSQCIHNKQKYTFIKHSCNTRFRIVWKIFKGHSALKLETPPSFWGWQGPWSIHQSLRLPQIKRRLSEPHGALGYNFIGIRSMDDGIAQSPNQA